MNGGKSTVQIGNDRARFNQPLGISIGVGDPEARYFRLSETLYEVGPILVVFLRVASLNVERQTTDFLSDPDAKRTGFELV
jgi:hypothetical protein